MKHHQYSTQAQGELSLRQIAGWAQTLHTWQQRLAPYFARPEPRQHAWLYLQAVLSEIPRKNGWQIAEYARQARPYGMQRLLSRAVWDHDGVRDELRCFVGHALNPAGPASPPAQALSPFPLLILDESGFPKRGCHSAGGQPQYCGGRWRV